MAPATKRKAIGGDYDDDFVYTLSDVDGEIPEDDEAVALPPKKKSKTKAKRGKKVKDATIEEDDGSEEEAEGVWGRKVDDDGAMDSEFEFMTEGGALEDDFGGWGFDGAKNGVDTERRGVDIEDIIRRRREKRGQNVGDAQVEVEGEGVEEDEEDQEDVDGLDLDLDDDDDQVLADDAFGMGIGSDGEDDEEGDDKDDEGDHDMDQHDEEDEGSDSDSVASAVPHPDDDERFDAEEEAKRKAFFAPEDGAHDTNGDKKKALASFQGMGLSRPIARGLGAVGFSKPTPIQAKTIPIALLGKDIVGGAVTGSGKTAAFLVPILERLMFRPKKIAVSRVVILAPTRELAIQCHAVATKLSAFTDIKFSLAVGGLSLKVQEAELRQRPDVIIATPGRFIDHMRNSPSFSVDTIEILVLDEADRMLEDGFADELNEILTTLPKSRQTMLFSATMTSSVDNLIRVGLNKPARIMVDSQQKTVGTLAQEFVRLRPGREGKRMGYLLHLCKTLYQERVIVFFRQKAEAHRARVIFALLGLSCAELHGSMNQTQRIASVEDFRDGKVAFLLATDLASRGLDIKGVDTVLNYEAPQKLEIYIHRIGRTARAGRSGVACTLAAEPDRKVVKAAVKAGKAQGAKISSRLVEAEDADRWQAKVNELEGEIEAILRDEKEERQLAHVEMQLKKGENILEHEAEIKARPKRTWFETQDDKKKAKEAGRAELNGGVVSALREKLKHKGQGHLSNKDKKKLDLRAERAAGGDGWRKGAAERVGKGVVADMKRGKVTKGRVTKGKGGKPGKAAARKGKAGKAGRK